MPLFRYQALSADGRKMSGIVEADSLVVAKERLRARQIFITELAVARGTRAVYQLKSPRRLAFTRELAQMLKAGLPLYDSMVTIEEKYRRDPGHPLLLDIIDRLKQGQSFSTALKLYPTTFDEIYIAMVQSAEETGTLPEVFGQLALLLEKREKLRKQIVFALIYPAFLLAFAFLVTMGLFFIVIPSMAELFEGRSVHPLTSFVLAISQFLRNNIVFLVLGAAALGTGAWYALRKKQTREELFSYCANLPLIGTLLLQSALARFFRCGSLLLDSGIPLIETLRLSRQVMRHPVFEEEIARIENKVLGGTKLQSELKHSSLFPTLVIRLLGIAEETGRMGEMFKALADIYEEEMEKSLTQLTTLLQPALLILLGAIVGLVILSILLPLTDVGGMMG